MESLDSLDTKQLFPNLSQIEMDLERDIDINVY